MKKEKKIYYLCTLNESSIYESVEDIEEVCDTINKCDLKNMGIDFLIDIPNDDSNGTCDDPDHDDVLKYPKLSELIDDYLWCFGEEVEMDLEYGYDKIFDKRINDLRTEFFILSFNKNTKKYSLVKNSVIENCISQNFQNNYSDKSIDFIINDKFSSEDIKIKDIDDKYLENFNCAVIKCFGKFTSGRIHFQSEYRIEPWDVNIINGKVVMGTEENHDILFPARLINLYNEQTVCMLRVFTDQKIENLVATELYCFVLYPNYIIENIDSQELFDVHTTDSNTNEKLMPEPNVIYCDVNGGKIII